MATATTKEKKRPGPPAATPTRAEVENFPWALRPLAPDFRRAGGGRVSWVRGGGGSTKGVQKNGGRRKGGGEWATSRKKGERRQPTDNNKKGVGKKTTASGLRTFSRTVLLTGLEPA